MHLTRGEGTSGSQRETKNMEIEREVRQGTHTDQPQCECLTTDVEYLGIGGISISTIKYAENLLANKRKKLQYMLDSLVVTERKYGIDIIIEKSKWMKIMWKQLQNVEQFKYIGSRLTNDGYIKEEIWSRIVENRASIRQGIANRI